MTLPAMKQLSARLKYLRDIHGLSQAELAQKAGTTQQAIQQAEKGKARQPRYLHQLARVMDVPVEWLLFGEIPSRNPAINKDGLKEKSSDVLDSFYAMPKKDQDLILELMQSRRDKSNKK